MKLFLTTIITIGTIAFSTTAFARVDQRVEIQPGGWVRIDPQVTTEVFCVGSSNQIARLCRCDSDIDGKFRVELVMITNGQSEKVVVLTPYYYPTYEACVAQAASMDACKVTK